MTNKNLEGRNMQTIIVLLNPGMLENADLDLRYRIPDRIEEGIKFFDTKQWI